ncbi:CXXC-type zinc finger protein 1-like [Carcharodon carcharias]|uniref:CXXC-type zinc finger protein 1-like n=1 Tax=Carcharodon carcharias TaxID=13397 RepID=UPI001B7EF5C7|nr:CXXC-type zinc finger protein 1-like [Carcharodon carcharias]
MAVACYSVAWVLLVAHMESPAVQLSDSRSVRCFPVRLRDSGACCTIAEAGGQRCSAFSQRQTLSPQGYDSERCVHIYTYLIYLLTHYIQSIEKEEKYRRHKQKQKRKQKTKQPEKVESKQLTSLRQCLGPGCVQAARQSSKYCSDECGIKLAANRIYEILPQRIQQWQQSPCIAEEHGKKLLEKIRREQQQARCKLQEMERKFHELETIIAKAKQQSIKEDEEVNEGDSEEADFQIFCVSCGHPINPKTAMKHMERCYAKYESQTSFGSMYPTRIEGATRLFCDVYNTQSKTYCKRLQVLCPEHSRDPKVSADEVCGCPIVKDVFELTGDFCRAAKRKCNKHYCWEKLRRAEVDLERVRVWYKLDELFEQERNVRIAMANRAGLLALMLHQTIQHDPVTTDLRSNKER